MRLVWFRSRQFDRSPVSRDGRTRETTLEVSDTAKLMEAPAVLGMAWSFFGVRIVLCSAWTGPEIRNVMIRVGAGGVDACV